MREKIAWNIDKEVREIASEAIKEVDASLRQGELAKYLGVSQATISRIKGRKHEIKAVDFLKIIYFSGYENTKIKDLLSGSLRIEVEQDARNLLSRQSSC